MASDFSTGDNSTSTTGQFESSVELQTWFRALPSGAKVASVGRGTKLVRELVNGGSVKVAGSDLYFADITGLSGIVAYDPTEFLLTAKAGTPMRDIVQALEEHGQFLPSDPCQLDEGATLGGTLAAGISGPARLLYGSLRDFVMEIEFLDGLGNLVRGGGKVVKNAAGFDFPKLMVGSLGRLGVITEATLKVFPRPAATATIVVRPESVQQAIHVAQALQGQPVPLNGITINCAQSTQMFVQVASPEASLLATSERVEAIITSVDGSLSVERIARSDEETQHNELAQQVFVFPGRPVVRTCQSPGKVAELDEQLARLGLPRQYWSAGEVCWIDASSISCDELDETLKQLSVSGLRFPLSFDDSCRIGATDWLAGANRLKSALDPDGRFPDY
ncbi:MAG: FAD-binding protein [Aureliella sp.]